MKLKFQKTFFMIVIFMAAVYGIYMAQPRGQSIALAEDSHTQERDDHADDHTDCTGEHSNDTHAGHDESDHDDHTEANDTESHDDHEGHDDHAEAHDTESHDDHEGHDDHTEAHDTESHDNHEGHDDNEDEGIRLNPEQRRNIGITVEPAGSGNIENKLTLPGEVVINDDLMVHLSPRIPGIARDVYKTVGDQVQKGDLLAVIDSRELADVKAEFMAAQARESLARINFQREKKLHEKKISSQQEYLDAQGAQVEARIELRSAEQKLHALGFSEKYLKNLADQHDAEITRYDIVAPFNGTVIRKHITHGESLEENAEIFAVADLSSLWINLSVYPKDLGAIQVGQEVLIQAEHDESSTLGRISMITPFIDESTRTATARVIIDNSDGRWFPGTFVSGFINISEEAVPIVIPKIAVQVVEGKNVVFVVDGDAFRMVPVQIGRSARTKVEIVAGLKPGTRYVTKGAFELKATVVTSNLDSHAGHGH